MSEWIKIKALNAGELLQHFELNEEAESVVNENVTPAGNIEALIDAGMYYDAVKLLAHGLPKREAIWWSCLVSRQVQTPETDEDNINALIAAETWARDPSEENRLRCRTLAEKTKHKTPASWAAMAACWSTGSMAEEGQPEIQTPEYLYAHAVSGSVTLAAVVQNPDEPASSFDHFLKQGINLAQGGNGQIEA